MTADLRGRGQGQGRDIIVLQTNDAGAFFRFTDMYSKMIGGQLELLHWSLRRSNPAPRKA